MRLISKVRLFVVSTLLLASCRMAKNVPQGNYLLHNTTIALDNPLTTNLDRYELAQVLRQQPNARFFWCTLEALALQRDGFFGRCREENT